MTDSTADLTEVDRRLPVNAVVAWLRRMWSTGWHPMDVVRLAGTGRDKRIIVRVVVDAIALDRRAWHPNAGRVWSDQADDLGATEIWWNQDQPYWSQLASRLGVAAWELHSAAAMIGLLTEMPERRQPAFEATPDQPGWSGDGSDVDSGVLARVRALLAKAESTEFDHEAETFSAKAQELIARHSIDLAVLAAEVDVPGGRRIYIDPPYAKAKYSLLAEVAEANTCRCVWNDGLTTATLVGHRADVHMSELLFSSLLLQGTAAVISAGSQHDGWGGNTTRSWRNAFWYGFAHRIGQRLAAAGRDARAHHDAETGTESLPVLAARRDAVDAALDEMFPNLGSVRTSLSNGDGLRAGAQFANRADLGTGSVTRRAPGELTA